MIDASELERGYRRWLKWYPKSFRAEHEAEILSMLMDDARGGQCRPEPIECLDLMAGAFRMRLVWPGQFCPKRATPIDVSFVLVGVDVLSTPLRTSAPIISEPWLVKCLIE